MTTEPAFPFGHTPAPDGGDPFPAPPQGVIGDLNCPPVCEKCGSCHAFEQPCVKTLLTVGSEWKLDTYSIVSRAVDEGIETGWNRAHKHTLTPEPDSIKQSIYNEVVNSLCEISKFE